MLELIGLAATAASTIVGYTQARSFTERKLRYVDAVHSAKAPVLAGAGAAVIAIPIVAVLPLVGIGTAVLFGAAVGGGVAAGARAIKRRLGA